MADVAGEREGVAVSMPDSMNLFEATRAASLAPVADALDRQMERGNLFMHTALGESFARLGEAQALLHGLTDVLLAKGVVTDGELLSAVERVRTELAERGELSGPGVAVRVDGPHAPERPPVQVDCAARMHVCQAVCCRLDFALSIPEIESGRIKWDLGRPYFVRHEVNGSCAHNDSLSGRCRIYADRPGVCRGYSCAGDSRIWTDFDAMVLNTEWIAQNLAPSEPKVVRAEMYVRAARASALAQEEVSP